MMSAGLLGSPGLGYFKDKYSGEALEQASPAVYAEYKAEKASQFIPILPEAYGLDAIKVGEITKKEGEPTAEEQQVLDASIEGDRKTLRTDALIPLTMAVIYLLLVLYFKGIGGYRAVKIDETPTEHEAEAYREAAATTGENLIPAC